ncbi:hypothetical protein [Brevibacillus sp. SKDU10]|uniref:hypothetical protein n=1 Tax=Brevibacillus sp. SKDU10 TaxID=1247872 RepID=UPI001E381EA5|nr:hypothetical protein [Brevibacillus sp. SKDU10]
MDEQELKKHLVNIVQEYGSRWNSIEDRIYKQHEQEEIESRDEYHYAKRTD